jgi:hypothetical protein
MNSDGVPSIGLAIVGAKVNLLDEDRNQVSDGTVDQIHVGGNGVELIERIIQGESLKKGQTIPE